MRGAGRHHLAVAMMIALLAGSAARLAAQDVTLVARCTPAQPASAAASPSGGAAERSGNAEATVGCDLRATDAAHFKSVRATLKGQSAPLATRFVAFDANRRSLAVMFLVQIMDVGRRSDANAMADAVIRIAEARDGRRRFAAYSIGNDLNLLADFDAARADFERQVRAIRSLRVPTQLFKNTLDAIAKLAKEAADRRALVILGDGTSDDPAAGYNHEQVVAAAKRAGVVIHALGYFAATEDLPKFQILRRLADDTGGFRREVRVGEGQKFPITAAFLGDVLANGGQISMALREPPGEVLVTLNAEFADARSASVDQRISVPSPPPGLAPVALPAQEAKRWRQSFSEWLGKNRGLAAIIGLATTLGLAGIGLYAFSKTSGTPVAARQKDGRTIYGWLDMLDANASRYPLQTTNVRIGRHRDNDICLQNDSISRRHALLHFNADNRRFVITDLGGNNGVIVNNIKQQSHELNDGDLVELGEVRLRFRSNVETTS